MLYVIARSGPQAPDGVTTVEFYVRGFPQSWFAIPTYNPSSNVNLGDMFKPSPVPVERFNQAYPTCQPRSNGMITIASVTVFPQSLVGETYLTVEVANPPSNAAYTRPVMILCDPPVYTAVLVNGGQFIMNGRACTVAVEDKTWRYELTKDRDPIVDGRGPAPDVGRAVLQAGEAESLADLGRPWDHGFRIPRGHGRSGRFPQPPCPLHRRRRQRSDEHAGNGDGGLEQIAGEDYHPEQCISRHGSAMAGSIL